MAKPLGANELNPFVDIHDEDRRNISAIANITLDLFANRLKVYGLCPEAIVPPLGLGSSLGPLMRDTGQIVRELVELITGLRLLSGWQNQLLQEIQKLTDDLHASVDSEGRPKEHN